MTHRDLPAWKEFLLRHLPRQIPEHYRFLRWYRFKPYLGYLRNLLAGRNGHRPSILFYPELPNYGSACLQIALRNGYRVVKDPSEPFDFAFHYEHGSQDTFETFARDLPYLTDAVNRDFTDIRKRTVADVFAQTFGYPLGVDPTTHTGACVKKSDRNGAHDGTIIQCPIEAPDPDYAYQKVVNNKTGDGLVQDIRVPIFEDTIPFVYLKFRPTETRFSNENAFVQLRPVEAVLSAEEVDQVLRFCRAMGMDYGELDVLRDEDDGRIYVVDANFTPAGVPNGLPPDEAEHAMNRMTRLFHEKYVAPRIEKAAVAA